MRRFASTEELTDEDLQASGPPSYPRPKRLEMPLDVKPARAAKAAAQLGLHTVGDLIAHLPRAHLDRRDARTLASLGIDEDSVGGRHDRADSARWCRA